MEHLRLSTNETAILGASKGRDCADCGERGAAKTLTEWRRRAVQGGFVMSEEEKVVVLRGYSSA
jgi:hypothetical protein